MEKVKAMTSKSYIRLPNNTMQQYPDGRSRSFGAPPTGRFTGPVSQQHPGRLQSWTEGMPAFLPSGPMPMGGPGGQGGPGGPRMSNMSATLPRQGLPGRRPGPTDPFMEMERMKRTMAILQEQLALADDTIRKLKVGPSGDKLSNEIHNGITMSGKFENISQGGIRPSHIIERYGGLYSQGRINAMDDLDQMAGLSKYGKHTEMKQKILYGIMVASYKVAYEYLTKLKTNIRRMLGIPEKHTPNDKDVHGEALTFLTSYFQTTAQTFSLEPIIQDVQDQLIQLLPEFPSMSRLPGISAYSVECCRVAWAMVNTIPPMELEHSLEKYNDASHTRFHASSEKNTKVKMYVWPTLLDSATKTVLFKGVVWT